MFIYINTLILGCKYNTIKRKQEWTLNTRFHKSLDLMAWKKLLSRAKKAIQPGGARLDQIKQTLLSLSSPFSLNICKPHLQFQIKLCVFLLLAGDVSLCLQGNFPEIRSISSIFHYYYYHYNIKAPLVFLFILYIHFHHKTTLSTLFITSNGREAGLHLSAWHRVVEKCI